MDGKNNMFMKQVALTICIFICQIFSVSAQNHYTINGYMRDSANGEELIYATILVEELAGTGTVTNAYGYYSITIPEGSYTVTAQYVGYESKSIKIDLDQNMQLDFSLSEAGYELGEIIITAEDKDENITGTQMGVEKMSMKEAERIPVLFGEKDILKTIQLRPGIKPDGEGNSGFFVRGGSADHNLVLLDEATVYTPAHFLGFFSIFNADVLKNVTLYKGSQSAEYGGRLASVLDVRMKDGNDRKFGVNGGIGLITSRINMEGPIVKEKGSFIVSARRTYADLFLKLSDDPSINQDQLYFYDINAKANYRINNKNRIFLSGYTGKDVLRTTNAGSDYRNVTGTLRWNHSFSDQIFANTSFVFSNYDYNIYVDRGNEYKVVSSIQDYNLKQDFQYYPGTRNTIKFGLQSTYHRIVPGTITLDDPSETSGIGITKKFAWANAAYISHQTNSVNFISLEYGIRFSSFSVIGPGDFYTYRTSGEIIDTTSFHSGEFAKTYFNLEPRIATNFRLNKKNSLKLAYGRNTQNLHLLSNFTSSSPTDMWIPSSMNVKPEIADQVSLGYFRNFKENAYEFSAEMYYKHLQNQIDYKDGAQLYFNETVESELLFGTGRAYGIEFLLRKKYGRLNGWIGYTLSRTEKRIRGINNGEYYPAQQDRTHDISIVATYELSEKWTLSATWVYYTGNAVSFPSGKYEVTGQVVNYYSERNGNRMPDYHRLDIGATWQGKKTKKFESSWNFSLYNAYGRENPYTITFRQDPYDPSQTQAVQTTLFRWIPSVTYNFKF